MSERPGKIHRSVSFYDARLRISTGVVEDYRPYLTIGTDSAEMTVSTTGGGPVTLADLELAERLVAAARDYRSKCRAAYTGALPA
ncbi:hypothetical protein DP939_42885 [Spongiactinospora rosea]|uniref:Uncharacterized protein n=2 Tax=Spongiactinospora rosea TaxID=2248750 RepID=A0A366LJG3_9ACTN|nr:hypothetical protein DP939_42885 [Spongiactinospora rosea]